MTDDIVRILRSTSQLEETASSLHDRERDALMALGKAYLAGLSGDAARFELRQVREEIEAVYAALRVLEARQDPLVPVESEVKAVDLARILPLTVWEIRSLEAEGMPHRLDEDQTTWYPIPDAVAWWRDREVERALNGRRPG